MTVYRRIVAEPIDDLPRLRGINLVRLDADHTELVTSDHPMYGRIRGQASEANNNGADLDALISDLGLQTVDSHANSPAVIMRVATPETHPEVDTAPYPNQAHYGGSDMPTVDLRAGRVIWEEG